MVGGQALEISTESCRAVENLEMEQNDASFSSNLMMIRCSLISMVYSSKRRAETLTNLGRVSSFPSMQFGLRLAFVQSLGKDSLL